MVWPTLGSRTAEEQNRTEETETIETLSPYPPLPLCPSPSRVRAVTVNVLLRLEEPSCNLHHDGEKRNQYPFVCVFSMLDRNW